MLKCMDSMLAPMRRHDRLVERTARISIDIKVKTRPQIHLLVFSGSNSRVIHIIWRGPAGKLTILDDRKIEREK